jgi:hypothetical protein
MLNGCSFFDFLKEALQPLHNVLISVPIMGPGAGGTVLEPVVQQGVVAAAVFEMI